MKRVIVYIDGFNLYYGLKNKGWKRLYWLNLVELSKRLIDPDHSPDHELVLTKYFTTRITTDDFSKKKRQDTYLDALQTLKNIEFFYGHYLYKPFECDNCGRIIKKYEEKMTDVHIATELLFDTFSDSFDTAIIVSGDSDLLPPIEKVKDKYPEKSIGVAFPPMRKSYELEAKADFAFEIGHTRLRKSVFSETITTSSGIILTRPTEWQNNRY